MLLAVKKAKAPIFFFQARNNYNLAPTQILSATMEKAKKEFQVKIYPSFGKTVQVDMLLDTLELQYGQRMSLFFCVSIVI